MENIILNKLRIGNFTSSAISALMTNGREKGSFGKPFYKYVKQKNMERRLGRSLSIEVNSRPTSWGKLLETRVFELLGIDYIPCFTGTYQHPFNSCWTGSPDATKKDKTVIDIKCPLTLESFCNLVDPLYNGLEGMDAMEWVISEHDAGEDYYWQLVSNAVLTGSKYAELIVYVPYQSELEFIRELASNYDGDQNKIAWINWAQDIDLPYLPDGGYYKNINIIRFEVPESAKEQLTKRIQEAEKLLIPNTL